MKIIVMPHAPTIKSSVDVNPEHSCVSRVLSDPSFAVSTLYKAVRHVWGSNSGQSNNFHCVPKFYEIVGIIFSCNEIYTWISYN